MGESKKASLTVLGGPRAHAGCELPDEGTVTIGSGEGCTLRIELPGVGPLHAAVMAGAGRVTVIDGGSGMPVHVNDNPVEPGGTQLRNGDILWLGSPADEGVVMLQCILPRRVEPAVASSATIALVPPIAAEPTPDIETTALYLEEAGARPAVGATAPPPPGEAQEPDAGEPGPTEAVPVETVAADASGGGTIPAEPESTFEPDVPNEPEPSFEPEATVATTVASEATPAPGVAFEPEAAAELAAAAAAALPASEPFDDVIETFPAEVRAEAEPHVADVHAADDAHADDAHAPDAEARTLILEGDTEAADSERTLLATPTAEPAASYDEAATIVERHAAGAADESSTVMFSVPSFESPAVDTEFQDETLVEPSGFESPVFEATHGEMVAGPAFDEPTVVGAVTEIDAGASTIVQSQEPTAFEVRPVATVGESEVEFEDATVSFAGTDDSAPAHDAPPPVPEPFFADEAALPAAAPLAPEPPPVAPEPPAAARPLPPEPVAPTPRPHPSASMGPTRREVAHGTHTPVAGRTQPPAVRARGGGSRTGLLVAAGLAAVVALGSVVYVGWRLQAGPAGPAPQVTPAALVQATPVATPAPATPEPAATAAPETVAPSAAPTVKPAATPTAAPAVVATPTPRPTPTPRATPTPAPTAAARPTPAPTPTPAGPSPAQQAAAQAQSLAEKAEQALATRQFDAAIGSAEAALKLDPGNPRANAARADAVRRRDFARRRFAAGQTAVQTQKAEKGGGLAGFDSGDADLRKAPDFQGRIEFEMSPASGIEPGAAWTLRAYVVNDGKKPIRVQGVTIATNASGGPSGGPVPPKTKEIAPQQRALVGEASGTWQDGTTAWATDVTVTANKGDSLRNTLTWR